MMTEPGGPPRRVPLCDDCLAELTQLLADWHTLCDTLAPLVSDEERVQGHLLAVIDQVEACGREHHQT